MRAKHHKLGRNRIPTDLVGLSLSVVRGSPGLLGFVLDGVKLIDQRPPANAEFLGRLCTISTRFDKGGQNRCPFDLRQPKPQAVPIRAHQDDTQRRPGLQIHLDSVR